MKDAAPDAVTRDHSQPDLDLVQPGGLGGGEMEGHVAVLFGPSLHGGTFVNREVVQDHMDGLPPMTDHGLIQEPHKLLTGVAWRTSPYHLAAVHLQSGKQRNGPVSHVLDRLPFRPGRLQRQRRLCAVQSLDRRLFVDAKNRCVLRRMQVQTQDVFGLGFKVRIRTGHVPPQSMWLQPGLVPDTHDRDIAQAQTSSQTTRGPMRERPWRMLFRDRQNGGLLRHRQLLRSSGTRGIQQTVQSLLLPTPLPMLNATRAHPGLRLNLSQRNSIGQQQEHPRSADQSGGETGSSQQHLFQAIAFRGLQLKGFAEVNMNSHIPYIASCVTYLCNTTLARPKIGAFPLR